MKALLTLPLAFLTFTFPASAEDACAQPTPEAMAEAAGVTLPKLPWHVANIWWSFAIFKRPEAERRHDVVPAP